MRIRFLAFIFLLITGCSTPATSLPLPTLDIVPIGFSPAAMIWQREMEDCVQSTPGFALAAYEYPDFASILDPKNIEFYVQIGNEIPPSMFVTQLGVENIVWITHVENPIRQLTIQQLSDLYQGKVPNPDKESSKRLDESLQIWVYPKNNILTKFLFENVTVSKSYLTAAYTAPDPAAMLAAVSDDPHALGFLPENWLQDHDQAKNVHIITLVEQTGGEFKPTIDVFAVSVTEPKSTSREALLCFKERLFATP